MPHQGAVTLSGLIADAEAAIASFGDDAAVLKAAAHFIANRRN